MKYCILFLIISGLYLYIDAIFNYNFTIFICKKLKQFFTSKPFKVLYNSFLRFLENTFINFDFKKFFNFIFKKR